MIQVLMLMYDAYDGPNADRLLLEQPLLRCYAGLICRHRYYRNPDFLPHRSPTRKNLGTSGDNTLMPVDPNIILHMNLAPHAGGSTLQTLDFYGQQHRLGTSNQRVAKLIGWFPLPSWHKHSVRLKVTSCLMFTTVQLPECRYAVLMQCLYARGYLVRCLLAMLRIDSIFIADLISPR